MSKDSKALQQKGKLLLFNPTGEYYFSKGLKAFHRKDLQNAIKYLQRAQKLEPYEPMIACQLAIVYTEAGKYYESNEILHNIIEELDEEMYECHYFLANNFAHLGFFKDAYHHANLYLELDKNGDFTNETLDLMELLTLESDEFDETPYEQDDLIIKQEQARELLESGHFLKVVDLLNGVIKEYPEYWSAYNNLALAYFYLGETEKANDILEEVLEKNNGNLHALCNKLVFAYYENKKEVSVPLKEALEKISPLSFDHQFKLGATFALIGEYQAAFPWLRNLLKKGFEGDGAFYYWLSYSAYYTGREKLAETAWVKTLEKNPEKAGLEPWNEKNEKARGFEDHVTSILKKLESNHIEERLFALFLTSISRKKEEILSANTLTNNKKFTSLERQYLSFIKSGNFLDNMLWSAHETAEIIYRRHQPIGPIEASLYVMWFTIFVELQKSGVNIHNQKAWAAAIEYVWSNIGKEKFSQQKIAEQYGLSTSTLRKYVKMVNNFIQ